MCAMQKKGPSDHAILEAYLLAITECARRCEHRVQSTSNNVLRIGFNDYFFAGVTELANVY